MKNYLSSVILRSMDNFVFIYPGSMISPNKVLPQTLFSLIFRSKYSHIIIEYHRSSRYFHESHKTYICVYIYIYIYVSHILSHIYIYIYTVPIKKKKKKHHDNLFLRYLISTRPFSSLELLPQPLVLSSQVWKIQGTICNSTVINQLYKSPSQTSIVCHSINMYTVNKLSMKNGSPFNGTWVSSPQIRQFQVAKKAQDRRPLGVPNGKTPVPCHVVIGMWQDVARCGKMWQESPICVSLYTQLCSHSLHACCNVRWRMPTQNE